MGYRKAKAIRNLTLGKRLALSIVALISVATLLLGLYGSRLTERFMKERFEDRMAFLARYLALNSELGILIGDHRMLEKLAKNLLSEKDVKGVEIRDSKGQILVSVGATKTQGLNETVYPVILRKEEEELVFSKNERLLETKIGSIHLFYSAESIEEVVKDFKSKTLIAALFLLITSAFIAILISRALTSPLKSLAEAAREVAKGSLDIRVKGGTLPETRELAMAFNNMLTALEESRHTLEATYQEMIQQKALAEVGEFAFTVAHEIKNPLGIIQGALDIIQKPEAGEDTKRTMIEYLKEELIRLNRIIQDFLEFSRPREPKLSTQNLGDLIDSIVKKAIVEWEPKGVKVKFQNTTHDIYGRVDADLLNQALLNLIKNACEACEKDISPCVMISAELKGQFFEISIEDNGPGIPDDIKNKIFEPFFTTKAKGTGLGLALVKRVIELHGGSIIISGKESLGTIVTLRLPITTTQLGESSASQPDILVGA